MKRPWQIWLALGLCLALVLPGFCWLTVKALELDRREAEARDQAEQARRMEAAARRQAETARQQAEQQERVSSALWRMDWTLTPIVAQEAARPYFVYRSFLPISGKGKSAPELTPSPLLIQPSPFVLLHFQITSDNEWSSPQSPPASLDQTALANGTTADNIERSEARLEQLKGLIRHREFLAELPERNLPPVPIDEAYYAGNLSWNYNGSPLAQPNTTVINDLGLSQFSGEQQEILENASPYNAPPPQTDGNYQSFENPSEVSQAENPSLSPPAGNESQLAQAEGVPPLQYGPASGVPAPAQPIDSPLPTVVPGRQQADTDTYGSAASPAGKPTPGTNAYTTPQPAESSPFELDPPSPVVTPAPPPAPARPALSPASQPVANPSVPSLPPITSAPSYSQSYPQTYSQPQQQASMPQQQAAAPAQTGSQGQPNAPAAGYDSYYRGEQQKLELRGGNEWQRRNRAYQNFAQNQLVQQRSYGSYGSNSDVELETPLQAVGEGVSRPIWVGPHLVLARRVTIGDQVLIQGCWLNWPAIRQMLLQEVADLLPDADLAPVLADTPVLPGRALATLPVQILAPAPQAVALAGAAPPFVVQASPDFSPIRLSLLIAWTCLLLATLAVMVLIQGVVTLSERRGSFVAAVTHELRTPLTTFRMYAEMLAAGMVATPEKRQRYLETLRVEADRLSHLVENVLSYARLERGKRGGRRESLPLDDLLDRIVERLRDRATQAEMELVLEIDKTSAGRLVLTDSSAVDQILFNLVDNACKYAQTAADRRVHLHARIAGREAVLSISDHGPGITAPQRRKLFQPFSKSVQEAAVSAPGVGLGLALSRRLAREIGGKLELLDQPTPGAHFVLRLPLAPPELKKRS
ncbi:sensor histidine kinase [Lignipirellula cremea]|uniref:histidine kinase n=1 Tax=Lignipirellula cremea TaxID=2528010 RepID=A0A518E313_9BACT|nr:HAMP domain-containing sensor histidine kinase [Lignipirellula cremea]QDU98479.1 Sensor protein SrrB [Lignipirellula cremea]